MEVKAEGPSSTSSTGPKKIGRAICLLLHTCEGAGCAPGWSTRVMARENDEEELGGGGTMYNSAD